MTDLVTGSFWRRVAARVIDCVIGLAVWALGSMWLLIGVWGLGAAPRDLGDLLVLALALPSLALALHIAYHVLFVAACGQTPGKMAAGIAVVRIDGGPVGVGRAGLRCLGGFLSAATLGLGYAGIVFTQERRGLADVLAGTRVVEHPAPVRAARAHAPSGLGSPLGA